MRKLMIMAKRISSAKDGTIKSFDLPKVYQALTFLSYFYYPSIGGICQVLNPIWYNNF